MGFRMELVQGATPICEGSCHLTPLRGTSCWNDCKSCKVRVGSNGNSLWEASVLLGRKKGCVMDTLKFTAMPFGLTNALAVFMELMSRSKEEYESHVKMIVESLNEEKMYVKFSKNMEAKQRGSYLDVEGIKWHAWKREKVIACTSRQLKVLMKDCMANMRDVRTLAIEEAYTTKYSIHPKVDTMLCGLRLTNRWLGMKKDIASCGSKYLASSEVEVEYQGSSGL
ncbi:hypothetical protein Tco_0307875 [Tanacetum coccineum]